MSTSDEMIYMVLDDNLHKHLVARSVKKGLSGETIAPDGSLVGSTGLGNSILTGLAPDGLDLLGDDMMLSNLGAQRFTKSLLSLLRRYIPKKDHRSNCAS